MFWTGRAPVRDREKSKKEEKYVSKTPTNTLVQKGGNTKLHNSLVYIRQHWQLYAFFIMPAFVLTIIFRYIPMGGIAIAFTDYNPIKGILGASSLGPGTSPGSCPPRTSWATCPTPSS